MCPLQCNQSGSHAFDFYSSVVEKESLWWWFTCYITLITSKQICLVIYHFISLSYYMLMLRSLSAFASNEDFKTVRNCSPPSIRITIMKIKLYNCHLVFTGGILIPGMVVFILKLSPDMCAFIYSNITQLPCNRELFFFHKTTTKLHPRMCFP